MTTPTAASRALLEAGPWSAPGSREPPAGKLQLESSPLLLGVCKRGNTRQGTPPLESSHEGVRMNSEQHWHCTGAKKRQQDPSTKASEGMQFSSFLYH